MKAIAISMDGNTCSGKLKYTNYWSLIVKVYFRGCKQVVGKKALRRDLYN